MVDFFGLNFWQTGGLKKKREAVRWPKSREVFNLRRENHMYGFVFGSIYLKTSPWPIKHDHSAEHYRR